jgi:hypothetical protein
MTLGGDRWRMTVSSDCWLKSPDPALLVDLDRLHGASGMPEATLWYSVTSTPERNDEAQRNLAQKAWTDLGGRGVPRRVRSTACADTAGSDGGPDGTNGSGLAPATHASARVYHTEVSAVDAADRSS